MSLRKEVRLPLKYIGVGEKIDDLQRFIADEFVDALFDMTEETTFVDVPAPAEHEAPLPEADEPISVAGNPTDNQEQEAPSGFVDSPSETVEPIAATADEGGDIESAAADTVAPVAMPADDTDPVPPPVEEPSKKKGFFKRFFGG